MKRLKKQGVVVGCLGIAVACLLSFTQAAHADEYPAVNVHGFVQSYFAWSDSTGNDTYDIRRAFIILKGEVAENLACNFQIDGGAPDNPLRSACLKYTRVPWANITVGQLKIPFSEEYLTSSAALDTIRRANVVRSLSYDRDIGVMLSGKVLADKLCYALGGFNGSGKNTADNNQTEDLIGRLVVSPFKGSGNSLDGLSLGGSCQIGQQPVSGNNEGIRSRIGALVKYTYTKLFKLQNEYIFQKYEQTDGSEKESMGFYSLMTYKFIPELQSILKYEAYDPNCAAAQDREGIITLGLDWFFAKHAKLEANYRIIYEELNDKINKECLLQMQFKF